MEPCWPGPAPTPRNHLWLNLCRTPAVIISCKNICVLLCYNSHDHRGFLGESTGTQGNSEKCKKSRFYWHLCAFYGVFRGASSRGRTDDLLITNQLLY